MGDVLFVTPHPKPRSEGATNPTPGKHKTKNNPVAKAHPPSPWFLWYVLKSLLTTVRVCVVPAVPTK